MNVQQAEILGRFAPTTEPRDGDLPGPEDLKVKKDLEGMQIMRTLGRNMAWLLKRIEAAKETAPFPERETRVATNFIR